MMSVVVMFLHDIENLQTIASKNGGGLLFPLCFRSLRNSEGTSCRSHGSVIYLRHRLTVLSLFGLYYFKEEALFFLKAFELFLSLIVHELKFVFLGMRAYLCSATCFDNGLYFLPIVSKLIKRYTIIN